MKTKYPIETVLQLERDDCKITNALSTMKGIRSITRLKIESDQTLHVVEKEDFTESEMKEVRAVSKKIAHAGNNKLWIYGKSCSACRAMAMSDAVLVSSTSVDAKRIIFRIIVENRGILRKIINDLSEQGLLPKIVEEPNDQKNEMSEREYAVLKMCYDLGFFENERVSSMTEIAKVMGISTSSLSETLRRAMRKAIRDFLSRKTP